VQTRQRPVPAQSNAYGLPVILSQALASPHRSVYPLSSPNTLMVRYNGTDEVDWNACKRFAKPQVISSSLQLPLLAMDASMNR
jgi:hypothetical protein